MFKKHMCIFVSALVLLTSFGFTSIKAEEKYEVWDESPFITSGFTEDDVRIAKTRRDNELETYKLTAVGSNVYLAIAEIKTSKGGVNSTSKTSKLYFYTLTISNGRYVLLSKANFTEQHSWDAGVNIRDLQSEVTNTSWYTSKGYEVPRYIVKANSVYTNTSSGYGKKGEYLIISTKGNLYTVTLDVTNPKPDDLVTYQGMLYWYKQQYSSSGLWQKYYDGGKQCIPFFPVMLKDGTATTDTANKLPIFELGLNVGEVSQKVPVSNMNLASTNSLITALTDTFPDGRKAIITWVCFNGSIYRTQYNIYNTSDTKIASGQFGQTRIFGTSDTKYELFVFALSNSKLIAAYFLLDYVMFYEVYRVSELTDSGGDIASSSGSIGVKDITPPDDTDTYPVKSSVDFSKSDIPLGFNIKDGAITEEKLNSSLREDITVNANAINAGDIVIVKKVGYISGKYNTGQTLATLNNYNYDYGSAYIRFYNNGSYFQWYCYNPELLDEGEYHQSFIVGKRTIYLRLKIIAPPTNSGTTAVTF